MHHLLLRIAFASLFLLIGSGGAHAQDWNQFRGPDGRAAFEKFSLPTDFGQESPEHQWSTNLEGSGISSPISVKNKVFLTSAYEGEERSRTEGLIETLGLALSLLGFASLLIWLKGRTKATEPPLAPWPRRVLALDTLGGLVCSMVFLGAVGIVIYSPETFWSAGLPGDAWLVSGAVCLLGLVAAFSFFQPGSLARLAGVLFLVVGAAFLWSELPLNKHRSVFKMAYRVVLVAPGIGGALWFLAGFAILRHRNASMKKTQWVGMITFGALATITFVATNFLNPKAGLVRALMCFDLETGVKEWSTPLFVAAEERIHRQNSFATPTPCSNGESILAFFGGGYACIDFEGNILWEGRDETFGDNSRYGCVSSPIPYKDTYILGVEGEQELRPSYLMALDAKTGEVRWRIEPKRAHDSYMTPLLMPVGGETQLIMASMSKVVAYDPDTGEQLWSQHVKIWQHAPSLTYEDDLLFVAGGAHHQFATMAIRLSGKGKQTTREILWQTRKNVPESPSPVYHSGILFTVDSGGIMVAYDPVSGKKHWRKRLGGNCLSSLIAADGKVLVCMEDGEIIIVAASPEFEILSRTTLGEPISATPALAQGRVLIRTSQALHCLKASDPK